ncbi:MAG TPA: hypothetical protein VF592_14215 [Sphingomonas sp.]|jgi:hypothetical protein|uniref:hypothetical protein n=1 Tax=Sphingomonas sp. TaxID=28214 RepID=UPI002ED9E7BC
MTGTGLDTVRAELNRRIAAIDDRAARSHARDLAGDLDQVRAIAHRAGLHPAVTVAHLLGGALSRGEHGPLVHGWLEMLRDAVGCDRSDPAACDAFAAACTVRFVG